MDVASRREPRPGASTAETPAGMVSPYSSFESAGLGLESSEHGFDGMDLQYGHEIDPMVECMGAIIREAPTPVSKLSRAQEEAMLAAIEETCSRTKALEYPDTADLRRLNDASGLMQQLLEEGSSLLPRAVNALSKLSSCGNFNAILGETGFVDVFLSILGTGDVLDEIVIPSLQFIGVTCEKTEANKARVVAREALLPILYNLWNPSLVPIAIPVIFQICLNYESAQRQAADLATARILVDLLKRQEGEGVPKGGGAYPVLLTICQLLDMILIKGTELYSDATAKELFELAKRNEKNSKLYVHLINTASNWLNLTKIKMHFVSDNNAELLLRILEESCTRPNLALLSTQDGMRLLQNLRIVTVETLAAISVTPQFCVIYKLNGKFVATLREWLPMAYPQLQACACIVLGNMANSWTSARDMTQQFRLHEVSLLLLEQCDAVQVKAAAAGLLKSLLVSRECRKEVAEKPIIKVASRLWGVTNSPHLQYLGVALALQALEGSFPVLEQLLTPLSPDPDSPAHSKTYLTILLRLLQDCDGYQQHEQLLLAIACIVANVCTMLWSPSPPLCSPKELEELKKRVLQQHADIQYPLIRLLRAENPPAVRSKFWFVMALMADDPQAVGIVGNTVGASEVSKAVSGLLARARKFGDGQCDKGQGLYDDRNVLIMISRLVKKTDSFKSRWQSEIVLKLVEGIDLEAMSKEDPLEPI